MKRRATHDERPTLTAELIDGDFDACRAFCEAYGYSPLAALRLRLIRRIGAPTTADVIEADLDELGWPLHLLPTWHRLAQGGRHDDRKDDAIARIRAAALLPPAGDPRSSVVRRRGVLDDRPPLTGELFDGDWPALVAFCDRYEYDVFAALKVRGNRRFLRDGSEPRWVLTEAEIDGLGGVTA